MTPIELILSRLTDPKQNGAGWQARCPAHDDTTPSLSVSEGANGGALVHCHAGCTAESIVSSLGLKLRDVRIEKIVFRDLGTPCAPVLVAVTLER